MLGQTHLSGNRLGSTGGRQVPPPPPGEGPSIPQPDGTVKASDDDMEYEAHKAVKPMVNKLFSDIASMNKVTGKTKPGSTNTATKLVDAALFSASNAHEAMQKRDKKKLEKDKQKKENTEAELRKERKVKSAARSNYRPNEKKKMRADEKSEMKNGVIAAKQEQQLLIRAFQSAVINKHRAQEARNKASERVASTKSELTKTRAAHETALLKQKSLHKRLREQLHQVKSSDGSATRVTNRLRQEKSVLWQKQQGAKKAKAALKVDRAAARALRKARGVLQAAVKKTKLTNEAQMKVQGKLDAILARKDKLRAKQDTQLREFEQTQLKLGKDLSGVTAERDTAKDGDPELSAKARVTEVRNQLRAGNERVEKLKASIKAGTADIEEDSKRKDLEQQIKSKTDDTEDAQKAEDAAKKKVQTAKKIAKGEDGTAEGVEKAKLKVQHNKEVIVRAKNRKAVLEEHLDKIKFDAESLQKQADNVDTAVLEGKRKLKELLRTKTNDEKALADADADIEIKTHEANQMRKDADRAVFKAKDLMKGAAAMEQEDGVRKIGKPEEAQDAIAAAKRSALVANAAMEAVERAITVSKMNKLGTEAANEATAAAMTAVKKNVASKLAAAASVASIENGASSIQKVAADKAAEAAQAAVATAARDDADKQKLETTSATAIKNAERAALKASIALANVDRLAKGKALKVMPAANPVSIKRDERETPDEVVAAEKQAGTAAKELLLTTMNEIKMFGKKTMAASKLVNEATDAASNLHAARASEQRAKQQLLRTKLAKASIHEKLQRLNDEKDQEEVKLKSLKQEQRATAAKPKSKTDTSQNGELNDIFEVQRDISRLVISIKENRQDLSKLRVKEDESRVKADDMNKVLKNAQAVETKVSKIAKPTNLKHDVETRELVEAKRAEMRYNIDKTAASVAMKDAADGAKDAKAAITKAKLDPESRKLIEASKLAILSARNTAQVAHSAIAKVKKAATAERQMRRVASKVARRLEKNEKALAASSHASAKVRKAKLLTQAAAHNEKEEVAKSEAAMAKATKAMENTGVNPNMQVAKDAIQKALKDAQIANKRATDAAKAREATEKNAEQERRQAKLLVQKAKLIAKSAQNELNRAQDASKMHSDAREEAEDAEKAVKQAEADIDDAENKAVSNAEKIEHLSLKQHVNSTIGNSTSNDTRQVEIENSAAKIIDDSIQKQMNLPAPTSEETSAAQAAAKEDSAEVGEAAKTALKRAASLKRAQQLEELQDRKEAQEDTMLVAKQKLNRVAEEKLDDAKAAVKAATNEKAEKKQNLKTWWKTRSKALRPSGTLVQAQRKVSAGDVSEHADAKKNKEDVEQAYSNKVVAVDTESEAFMNDAKSGLEVALAKEMMTAKEVETQRVGVFEAKNVVEIEKKRVKGLQREARNAQHNFQAQSAKLIKDSKDAAEEKAAPGKNTEAAAAIDAEKLGMKAISKLVSAAENDKQVKAAVKNVAKIRKQLTAAYTALRAANVGKERAQKNEKLDNTEEHTRATRAWTTAYKERQVKFSMLNANLEKENWKIQLSTVTTKKLLINDIPALQAGTSRNPKESEKLEGLLADLAAADARTAKEQAKLDVFKKELVKTQQGENQAALSVSEATGAAKYAAKLQEYVWAQKKKIAEARVKGQRVEVAAAQKHRKSFNALKASQNVELPGVSKADLQKAKAALNSSVSAVKEAKTAEKSVENAAKEQQQQEEKQIEQTLGVWKKVQDSASDSDNSIHDVKLRNMNHL